MERRLRRRWRSLAPLIALCAYLLLGAVAPAANAAPERWCPREAAPFCSENAFLEYWKAVDAETGGLALDVIGFPITNALRRPGDGLIVQFYERAILEWHPKQPRQYQVMLSRLGAAAIDTDTTLGLKQRQAEPPIPCDGATSCAIFDRTAHSLRGSFLAYWLRNGGLDLYGFPLTEPFQLRQSDGAGYTVQYFERNRFEAHPENRDERYKVLLGRLGAEELGRNRAAVSAWPAVTTPSYGYPGSPPATGVTAAVDPASGPRGTVFVISLAGLPPGALLVSTITYPNGQSASKTYQLGATQTTAREQISTGATSQIGTRTVSYAIGAVEVARVAYTVTGAPAAPPVASPADAALVQAGNDLIAAVTEMRYITDTLSARGVTWSFRELANAWGAYYPGQRAIVYATALRGMDPHDIASVTGHEGQHAYDIFTYGPPASAESCYKLEYRGFLAAATLWHVWYGPQGKANPVNDLERDNNAILADILYNNGDQLKKFILNAYASECGAWLTGRVDGTGGGRDIPITTEGLPELVTTLLPGAAAQLAWFASDQLTAASLPGPVPTWRLR